MISPSARTTAASTRLGTGGGLRRRALVAAAIGAAVLAGAVTHPTVQAGDETLAPATTTTVTTTPSTSTPSTSTTSTLAGAGTTGTTVATPAAAAVVPAPLAVAANVTKPAKRLRQTGSLFFPMQTTPRCAILDNFGDPRSGGRSHQGVDMLATLDQEVYAVADGVLTTQYVVGGPNSALSGNAWKLVTSDGTGTYYFYAHLSSFPDGLTLGATVHQGDLIGYVGDTGDPGPGNYHLHFEVHPNGGVAVNGLPLLEVPAACSIT